MTTEAATRIRRVEPSQGWRWIVGGFALFRRSPPMWIVLVLILYLLAALVNYAPFFGALLMLFYPVIIAGLMSGCRDLEQGRELQIGHLVAGFRLNPVHLTTIGGVYLVGQVLTMWVMVAIGGNELLLLLEGRPDRLDPEVVVEAFGRLTTALIVGTLMSLPLLMAVLYAPMVVAFENRRALPAMKASIVASWKNVLALFVYALVLAALIVIAMIPFGLGGAPVNPGVFIVMPFVLPSLWVSYRDIFRAD
jgi:hypothetical protein